MLKYYLSKSLRIPRRLRKIYYTRFNRLKFWLNDVKFGRNMQVFTKCYLTKANGSRITIGDDCIITSSDGFNPLCRVQRAMIFAEPGAIVSIGNNTGLSSPCIWCKESITIGDNVKIGGDCVIMDTDCHNLDWRIRRSKEKTDDGRSIDGYTAKSAPIVVEDDVLVGTRCIILKGVTIGARSVIAAGSVVTKSIPADCIAGGNPCKVMRHLKDE